MKFVLMGFVVLVAGCSSAPSRPAAAVGPDVAVPVIDAHTHFDGGGTGPSAAMLKTLTDNGVVGAVVHAPRSGVAQSGVPRNDGPRLAICAAAVPGASVKDVERAIDQGIYSCLKIYLAYVPKYATDPFYRRFYNLAEKKRVPIVFHTGDPYDKKALVKYADPLTIDEIAVRYPKVTFVLAHLGNPWIQSAAEVTFKNDNVYADTSGLMLGDLSKSNPEAVEELVVKPIRWFLTYVESPTKLLFGSDWPLVEIGPYVAAVKRAIPREHWDAVFHANARRVFRLGANK